MNALWRHVKQTKSHPPTPPKPSICTLFAHIHIYTYILPFPPLQPRISTLFAALESHDLVNGPCLPVYFYHNLFFEPPIAIFNIPHILCKIYSTNIFTYIVYITSTVDTVHVAYTIYILSKTTYTMYIYICSRWSKAPDLDAQWPVVAPTSIYIVPTFWLWVPA